MQQMATELADRRPHLDRLESYYKGENWIPIHAGRQMRDSYRRLVDMARLNLARLIVEATRELMEPIGFRTGSVSDELGDAEAWRIWQANSLDADHMLVDRATLTMGRAAMMVGPVDDEIGAPLITPEDPRQVIVRTDPRRRRRVTAGLKLYVDGDAGMDRAVAEAHLQNSALHSQTIDSDKAAREMGITGVPFFIFNRQVGLSGAHEAETLLQGMEEAMSAPTND